MCVILEEEFIMTTTHNLGFPRIGGKRELKFLLEAYWKGILSKEKLLEEAAQLRQQNWQKQSGLDLVPVGDFSLYDQVLDMSFTLGNVPGRAKSLQANELDTYFRVARGQSGNESACQCIQAGEMTKWFDTNYHYIVPEFDRYTQFSLHAERLLQQVDEVQHLGAAAKPVIIGPVTYLWLGKSKDGSNKLDLLPSLLPVYKQLLKALADRGVEWVQIDEPILVTELDGQWQKAFEIAYHYLNEKFVKLLLTSYFGRLDENLALACQLPVQGLHLDVTHGLADVEPAITQLPEDGVLSLGVISGRNIWRSDISQILAWLEPVHQRLGERLWLAPSCSLLHVPVDLEAENAMDEEIKSWLAFALQKLEELQLVAAALDKGRSAVAEQLQINADARKSRQHSPRVHSRAVHRALENITPAMAQRQSPYPVRAEQQRNKLKLPAFPTTTIGSFPQTAEIRQFRRRYRQGEISDQQYQQLMQQEIAHCIREQELLGLDVLVHGEAERNDMVEYFGEQLAGFIFSRFGWVQSYGSRCVKPPIIYGDVCRTQPMTVDWTTYAQSLTGRPVKGMLTGPVTILNWSFVRDDQPRSLTCQQIALAIREEVLDLERAGIDIIQIDEAALREGLPLRHSDWDTYLQWAIGAFRLAANGVADTTQLHTHMCYSEFNDIIQGIAAMDADVITIETSRSDMELLDAFDQFNYPNDIGPGVYDIHSPNIPAVESIVSLMQKAQQRIPAGRLWINPDCGLKTRQWHEVVPALTHMVEAAGRLREQLAAS